MQSSDQRRGPWKWITLVCLLIAVAAAVVLSILILTDDDEGIPDAVPVVGDDDDDEIARPDVEFTNLEDGDTIAVGEAVEVRASSPNGIETITFFVSGAAEMLTAAGGGNEEIEVEFPFTIEESGTYTLDVQATASDGTVSEPLRIDIVVE